MERLTTKYMEYSVPKDACTINRLGEADDCMSCKEVCEECNETCDICCIQKCLNKLADYEDAEKQGLLLRLPCKVDDTVYIVTSNYFNCQNECDVFKPDEFYKTWCEKYCPNGYKGIGVVETKATAIDVRKSDVYIRTDKCGFRNFKNVFLTKEEAARALAEMK